MTNTQNVSRDESMHCMDDHQQTHRFFFSFSDIIEITKRRTFYLIDYVAARL